MSYIIRKDGRFEDSGKDQYLKSVSPDGPEWTENPAEAMTCPAPGEAQGIVDVLKKGGGAKLQIFPDDGSVSFTAPFPDAETVEEDGVVVRWKAKPISTGSYATPPARTHQPEMQGQGPGLTNKQLADIVKQNERNKDT